MSNAHIVERLTSLADSLDCGDISLREFAEQVPGHTTALDNLPYAQIREARIAAIEIDQMATLHGSRSGGRSKSCLGLAASLVSEHPDLTTSFASYQG